MIKIFRKIRQKLLSENKFSKYLLYAIGEIILVVIGILIALSIDNWNDTAKSKSKVSKYLSNIEAEIISDSLFLENSWFRNRNKKIECLEVAKQFVMGTYIPKDTLLFINNVGFGGINSRASFTGSSRTYNELVSTGNLSLISNDTIRDQIVKYYSNKVFTDEYVSNMRSDYASYVNSLKVYNPQYRDSINPLEIPRILKKMKTDEFHGLINQELTYAYSLERSLRASKKNAHELQKVIRRFLKNVY
ncbi:DUF6090 family protein [Cellulophaga tyrosinoxydans]|uniref:Uncharacterized protein n=1 Tax=Cellulophaga tyrosinoxydans TaxID=504486 RepID=A0A1W1YTU0_9FLAO|nr:DUF6090 family protein [Cellulophaga tyrosinoxydans]SMC39569.1 hypothetical protein SAMN05660703_0876 [Cellulophaga tyrosinoxydans]